MSILLTRDLTERGTDARELARMARDGTLEHLRRGAYAPAGTRDDTEQHRLQIEAAVRLAEAESYVSFGSAGVLHGLPVWRQSIMKVHLTRSRTHHGRVRRNVHVHVAPLREQDVTEIDGIPVTSPARTLVDLARTSSAAAGVAAGDHALATGLDPDDLADALHDGGRRHGIRRARWVASLLDGRAESAGESYSRLRMIEADLPVPDLQVVIDAVRGFDPRVDFLWPDVGLIGEFDGKVKYGRLLGPADDPGEVVFREKVREDRLRELGFEVVRWIWDDLARPQLFAARLRQALERAAARRR